MRVVVTAGGTGGHINPAMVVVKELKGLGNTALFIGGLNGPEKQMAEKMGIEFLGIKVSGLDRSNPLSMVKSLLLFPLAAIRAMRALNVFRPDAVIGVGGYASAPASVAAVVQGIPLFLLEQNVYPGLVTRKLAKFAKKVFVTFEGSKKWLGGAKVVATGNPTREGFYFGSNRKMDDGEMTLLVMGGSQGASSINRAMMEALDSLSGLNLKIYHQTGQKDFESVNNAYMEKIPNSVVKPFFEDMPEIMRKADLALCRAGASTCCELNLLGLPSILIPYPGAGGHQKLNAEALSQNGASEMMLDSELSGERLSSTIKELLLDKERLELMSANNREMAKPDAAKKIINEILTTVEA